MPPGKGEEVYEYRWRSMVDCAKSALADVVGSPALSHASARRDERDHRLEWDCVSGNHRRERRKVPRRLCVVWFAYSSLAVYDAVNAITGQDQPHSITAPPDRRTHPSTPRQLRQRTAYWSTSFPRKQANLDTLLASSLGAINATPDAKTAGVAVGEAAAAAVINARFGDGLQANIPYVPGTGPGAWIPTPPNFPSPVTPWLAGT